MNEPELDGVEAVPVLRQTKHHIPEGTSIWHKRPDGICCSVLSLRCRGTDGLWAWRGFASDDGGRSELLE